METKIEYVVRIRVEVNFINSMYCEQRELKFPSLDQATSAATALVACIQTGDLAAFRQLVEGFGYRFGDALPVAVDTRVLIRTIYTVEQLYPCESAT